MCHKIIAMFVEEHTSIAEESSMYRYVQITVANSGSEKFLRVERKMLVEIYACGEQVTQRMFRVSTLSEAIFVQWNRFNERKLTNKIHAYAILHFIRYLRIE